MMRFPVSKTTIGHHERALVNETLDKNQLSYGPMTRAFESALADYLGVEHVLAASSGTTALHLVLAACGIGRGDEVLVPDLTFVATANAVAYTGATPVLVDVDPRTWCMDAVAAEEKITSRTRAILPVHLYGVPCDMSEILQVAHYHGLQVIEDAAEGFSGSFYGRALGTIGNAGIFSFYGNKILTTGEGGAIATNDARLAERLYLLRGQALDPHRRYFHPEIGFNYRITDLQSAVGVGQMLHLDDMLEKRRAIFERYTSRLCYNSFAPCVRPDTLHAPWLFTVTLHPSINRDALMATLATQGIETRPTFVPLHRMPMYHGPTDVDFPGASFVGDHGVSLPTYPELSLQEVDEICDVILPLLPEMRTPILSNSSGIRTR